LRQPLWTPSVGRTCTRRNDSELRCTNPGQLRPRHGSNRASEDTVRQIKLKLLHIVGTIAIITTIAGTATTERSGKKTARSALTTCGRAATAPLQQPYQEQSNQR